MDMTKEKHYNFDWKVAKMIGLYQVLNPDSNKIYGYNVFHIAMVGIILEPFVLTLYNFKMIMTYYKTHDFVGFIYLTVLSLSFWSNYYKLYVIIRHSNKIWRYLEILKWDFLSHQRYDREIFNKRRIIYKRFSYILFVIIVVGMITWNLSPYILRNQFVTKKNPDGSVSKFRMNIYNMDFMVSDVTYNTYFGVFFTIELIMNATGFINIGHSVLLMVMTCLAICGQLETLCNAIESLGHGQNSSDNIIGINNVNILKEKYVANDEIILVIKDHKKILKSIKEYYDIFQTSLLVDISVLVCEHITSIFIILIYYLNTDIENSILAFKIIAAFPLVSFQLFMTCYLFGSINEKLEAVEFAFYSCNWTETDIKSQKLVLNAMIMNSENRLKIKFSDTKIVNVEMFAAIMRLCYSVISMLLNVTNK